MKILQVTAPGVFEVLQTPIPNAGDGEVLIRIDAVTTCPQWDLHLNHNEPMFVGHQFTYPYTLGQPGHEASGEIVAVGAGVTAVAVGDRVSVWRDAGHSVQGCYAQYAVRPVEHVIRVPARLPPSATAPLELAMCVGSVFLMLQPMQALAGRRVGITGLGPAGLVAAQMARAEGAAEIIGFDPSPTRREHALKVGVDAAYNPRDDLADLFPARPARPALDCAIDCVGAKASVEFLMDHTEDFVALFGVQREDYTFAPRHYRGLRLLGYKGHSREAAEYAVGLMERGLLDLAPLVTHHLPLERYDEAVRLLERQEAIKVCFTPFEG